MKVEQVYDEINRMIREDKIIRMSSANFYYKDKLIILIRAVGNNYYAIKTQGDNSLSRSNYPMVRGDTLCQ